MRLANFCLEDTGANNFLVYCAARHAGSRGLALQDGVCVSAACSRFRCCFCRKRFISHNVGTAEGCPFWLLSQ